MTRTDRFIAAITHELECNRASIDVDDSLHELAVHVCVNDAGFVRNSWLERETKKRDTAEVRR